MRAREEANRPFSDECDSPFVFRTVLDSLTISFVALCVWAAALLLAIRPLMEGAIGDPFADDAPMVKGRIGAAVVLLSCALFVSVAGYLFGRYRRGALVGFSAVGTVFGCLLFATFAHLLTGGRTPFTLENYLTVFGLAAVFAALTAWGRRSAK